jgi:Tol biopolymer transport system component
MSGLRTRFNVEPAQFWLASNGTLIYSPGGAFRNERRLAIVDASGNVRPWSDERHAFGGAPSATRDGRRLAAVITNAQGIDEIWISDMDRPALRRVVAVPDADCDLGAISPDGQWIAFTRNGRDSSDGVYIQRSDGQSEARRVYRPPSPDAAMNCTMWTPDGGSLLGFVTSGGVAHAALLPGVLEEGGPVEPRQIIRGFHDEVVPVISSDGRLLAFISGESGRGEVYVCAFNKEGGVSDPIRVSTDGAQYALWRAGTHDLAYLDPNGHVMATTIQVTPMLSAGPPTLQFDATAVRMLSATPLPDGRALAIVGSESESDEVTNLDVVLNFFDEVRSKTRAAR